jgi:hypothetical protein
MIPLSSQLLLYTSARIRGVHGGIQSFATLHSESRSSRDPPPRPAEIRGAIASSPSSFNEATGTSYGDYSTRRECDRKPNALIAMQ